MILNNEIMKWNKILLLIDGNFEILYSLIKLIFNLK